MPSPEREVLITALRHYPNRLEALVSGLTDEQLNTEFIPGEWTVAQNVHHLADSHTQAFSRLKLILTENHPTIKPYNQDEWAKTADYAAPISASLSILRGLHERWATLYERLAPGQWVRTGFHPETGIITPDTLLQSYVNHGEAHIDQIKKTLAAGGHG